MLSELKGKCKVIGVKQSMKAIRADQAQAVYFADDADPALLEPIAALCREKAIEVITVSTMAALGQACEIEVGAAVAALLKDSCED